ncbi:tyrosine-type recombinase/integrase [uncultured Pontibacter sp.]|uniref:tyrosine-type recombinase/integrase n=1 Tax=uncultured Pontibacter sp. TaxID=453356 RepID=UPI002614496C|nr:tyrosine-type recombinase/integrase [uncultured Pontibacter sp.]
MEVNKYLRKDRVDKNGYAPIRFTVYLNGKRIHLSPGEKCMPDQWLEEEQRMDGNAPYANVINTKLDHWHNTLFDIFHDYKKKTALLTPELLKEELLERVAEPAPEPEPAEELYPYPFPEEEEATEEDPKSQFFTLFYQWRDQLAMKRQKGSGRRTSPNTIKGVNSSIKRFDEFEVHRGIPLTLEGCDKAFYQEFERYIMDTLKQEINTFGKHVAKLKSFLRWCEEELELEVNRKYRRFEAPSIYVGVDALSARELESIYKLNFQSEEIRKIVHSGYSSKSEFDINGPEINARLKDLEIARDVFLMCCYTGMRISDVIKLNYSYIRDEHIEIPATKTLNTCYIPLYDDSLFKPNEILAKYDGLQETCLPASPLVNEHLKTIQSLVKLRRLKLTTKIGRKTFVTLKIYQGVPSRLIMQATGHKTEAAFNRYAGIDTNELIQEFKRQSAKMGARNSVGAGAELGAK